MTSGTERAYVHIVERLAAARGIDLKQISSWENLSDPTLLGEMPRACERIQRAVERRETIGIIGDYDADGITGVAQLVRFFRRRNREPHVILPHRERHGYGVKKEFIDTLHVKEVTLLLTVDTGIGAVEEIAWARENGMDVIVLDHHEPRTSRGYMASHASSQELPEAILVHPMLPAPRSPKGEVGSTANCLPREARRAKWGYLSGSGVAFTLLRALEGQKWEGCDIDAALAALGTVGDVVPLLGENRTIVALGLEALNQAFCAGCAPYQRGALGAWGTGQALHAPLFALAKSVIKNGEQFKSSHLAFRIAPRINAAGRIADPALALKVLLEGGPYIEQLHTLNQRRQLMTEKMMEVALREIEEESPVLACASSLLHIGIIGLLASKLTGRYGRPSVVGHEKDHLITCSLRSVPSYNIIQALGRCTEHLLSFGGHEMAAGCTLEKGGWRAFIHALSSDAANILGEEPRAPTLRIDTMLTPQDITAPFVQALEALEPFGAGNPEPLFLLQNQKFSSPRLVGRDEKHLQCVVNGMKAIGFGLGEYLTALPEEADIVCRLGIDQWNGKEQVQLFIEDIAASTPLTELPESSRGAKERLYTLPPR